MHPQMLMGPSLSGKQFLCHVGITKLYSEYVPQHPRPFTPDLRYGTTLRFACAANWYRLPITDYPFATCTPFPVPSSPLPDT